MPASSPIKNSAVVWQIQEVLRKKGHKIALDGDLGPEHFWDSSETLKAVLKELGGPITKIPLPTPKPSETGKSIFIDIGHGPKPDRFDPGAVHAPKGPTEHALNKIGAEALAARLRERGLEVEISDANLHNYPAGQAAKGHDVLVSFHHNATLNPAQYSLAIHDIKAPSKEVVALAEKVSAAVAAELRIPDKGARGMSLSVLSGARSVGVPLAILVEPYFIHAQSPANPLPAAMPDWSTRAGQAIGDAIADYLLGA